MKLSRFVRTKVAVGALGAAMLTVTAQSAFASAFALQEQSGSGMGNAFAAGAANADDASTIYTNPAGMGRLPGMQAVVGGGWICPSAKFSDNGSQPASLQQLGGSGGDAGSCAGVPNVYFVAPVNRQWSFGIGVNAPFGLKTEYDSGWIGRFQAIKSDVKTVNVNPSVSFRVNDTLTIGGGANWQRINATLTSQVNWAAAFAQGVQQGVAAGQIPPQAVPALVGAAAGLESGANISGNDSGWGWNIGALLELDARTRVGAAYRSKIKYTISGSANFNNPMLGPLPPTLAPVGALISAGVNAVLASGDVTLALEVPDSANVSIFHVVNNQWDLMADVQFTGWSSVQELKVVRSTGTVLSQTPENFRDTWRGSVGANYHYSPAWTFRGGLAFDQSPVRDAQRTPRLPDNDRTWFSFGVQYHFSPQLVFDVGYTYITVKDTTINQNEGSTPANGLISGTYKNNVNIGAAQITYTF